MTDPRALLGGVVCQTIAPALPDTVTMMIPDRIISLPPAPGRWQVAVEPRADGVEVRVHHLVPYPAASEQIVSVEYAARVTDAVRAALAALGAPERAAEPPVAALAPRR